MKTTFIFSNLAWATPSTEGLWGCFWGQSANRLIPFPGQLVSWWAADTTIGQHLADFRSAPGNFDRNVQILVEIIKFNGLSIELSEFSLNYSCCSTNHIWFRRNLRPNGSPNPIPPKRLKIEHSKSYRTNCLLNSFEHSLLTKPSIVFRERERAERIGRFGRRRQRRGRRRGDRRRRSGRWRQGRPKEAATSPKDPLHVSAAAGTGGDVRT